jgi:hypothetical protein
MTSIVPKELRGYFGWDWRHDSMAAKVMAEFELKRRDGGCP